MVTRLMSSGLRVRGLDAGGAAHGGNFAASLTLGEPLR
jgi:hypothetical protein